MTSYSANFKIAAIAAGLVAVGAMPGMAASKKRVPPAPYAHSAPFATGGAYGSWFFSDGSQERLGRTVAGAAPNILATGAGVRCQFRYVVRNGQRIKYEYCD
jgi:hypothetical protein